MYYISYNFTSMFLVNKSVSRCFIKHFLIVFFDFFRENHFSADAASGLFAGKGVAHPIFPSAEIRHSICAVWCLFPAIAAITEPFIFHISFCSHFKRPLSL